MVFVVKVLLQRNRITTEFGVSKYAVACIDRARHWRALFVSNLQDTALPFDRGLMNGLENLDD